MTDVLEIKTIPKPDSQKIIGYYPQGGVVEIDGKLFWLRHPQFRWNGSSFGWENDGFSSSDLSEVGYHLIPPERELTQKLAEENLKSLKEGFFPSNFTVGIEVEGCLYDKNCNLIPKHDGQLVKIDEDKHPELLNFTVETSTNPINGNHLSSPLEIAHGLTSAILEGYDVGEKRNGLIVYSSVPEAGHFFQAQITPHPYLLSFAPKVLVFTLENWEKIPQQAKDLYGFLGIDIQTYLEQTSILNWPVNALHVHTGIPLIDNLADPRIAYAYGIIRHTKMAKIFSFLLYNSSYFYGVDTNLKDVRSICRRLLATAIDGSLPENAEILMQKMAQDLTLGKIHSPSRFPATGQHDRVRFRAEGQYKTIESIDAPMTADLRLVLGWVFFNQILNVIALEAIYESDGNESRVIDFLKTRYGNLFNILPTLGEISSFSYDLIFNQFGLDGKLNGKSIKEELLELKSIINHCGEKYPAIKTQAQIVSYLIDQALSDQNLDLVSYLGIEAGYYRPNRQNTGLLTEAKKSLSPQELIKTQSQATITQALTLSQVSNESDLLEFFGL